MNTFGNRSLTRWSVVLATVLFVASCGGDNDDDVAAIDGSATPASTGTPAGADNSNTPNETRNDAPTDPADNVALPENAFATTLSGAEEVPPVTTTATGTGVVVVDPDTLAMKATIVTAGIAGTAAHIHIAPPGVAGPIVFPLTETATASGIWTTQATLTANQLAELRAGNYYFNVHSAAYPNGEIRGQILRGANNGTTGTGTATTDPATTGTGATGTSGTTTTATGATQPGSATSTSGTGATGTATPGSDTTGAGTTGTDTSGTGTTTTGTTGTSGTTTADGNTSTTVPAGTASTAVSTTARSTFINVLRGSEQIPANTSSAVAIAVAIFDPVAQTLTSAITTMGLTGTEAHIHQALPGAAGPIIFPMTETATGSGIWTANAALNDEGVTSVASGFFYFDIHSAAFPNGEVRAQIVPRASAGTDTANTDTIEDGGTETGGTSTAGVVSPGTGTTGTDATGADPTGTGTTSTGASSPAITSPTDTTPTGTTPTGTPGA